MNRHILLGNSFENSKEREVITAVLKKQDYFQTGTWCMELLSANLWENAI